MRRFFTIGLLLISFLSIGQDGQFSQYFASQIFINPAFAGVNPNYRITTSYKQEQSLSSDINPYLFQVTALVPLQRTEDENYQAGGIAFTAFNSRQGLGATLLTNQFLLSGAYVLRLNRLLNHHLIFGLQLGFTNSQLSGDHLRWGSQYNPYIGYDDTKPGEQLQEFQTLYPNVNIGVLYSFFDIENSYFRDQSLSVGFSVRSVNQPEIGYIFEDSFREQMLFQSILLSKFKLSGKTYLHPSVYHLFREGKSQLNLGTYLSHVVVDSRNKKATLLQGGIWYRAGDAVILMVGMQYQQVTVGFSSDFNNSSINQNEVRDADYAAYEISLSLNLDFKKPVKTTVNPIF